MSLRLVIGPRLLVASHNAGKIDEIGALLAPMGIAAVPAVDFALPEPEETETTFHGNAAIKALAASGATGLPALSDDSGLVIDGLGGAPGVYTADWAGPTKDFAAAMARVMGELAQAGCLSPATRRARFVSVLALAIPGEETRYFQGVVDGTIADAPRGASGFGYDPIFIPDDGDGRTFAEMDRAEKSGGARPLSHRARALALLQQAILSQETVS